MSVRGPPGRVSTGLRLPGVRAVVCVSSTSQHRPALRESVRIGEQNLYAGAKQLVGDRNPREDEFTVQMRPMDADKSGEGLGVPVLIALCGAVLGRNTRGGAIVSGALNLGGSIEPVPNATQIAELAVDKQAQTLLMPVSGTPATQ